MSALTTRTGSERIPSIQPFSYAEAAKGKSSAAPAQQHSPEASGKQSPATTEIPNANASVNRTLNGAGASDSITEDAISQQSPDNTRSMTDPDNASATASTVTSPAVHTKTTLESKQATSANTSPSLDATSSSTIPKEDDILVTPNGSSDSAWDKHSQVSNSAEKQTQIGEGGNDKSADIAWDTNVTGQKELKAAPIPTINIWEQRKLAQDAKMKTMVKSALPPPPPFPSNPVKSGSPTLQSNEESGIDQSKSSNKKRPSIPRAPEDVANTPKPDKKRIEGGKTRDEGTRKSGFRPSRSPEKEKTSDSSPPPPVGDVELWPTPNIAQDGSKRKILDKVERTEGIEKEKSPGGRPHGKEKWVSVPYVPTAVFETPLPPNARRGGRGGARGGRDSGTRGSHAPSNSTSGDKLGIGSMGPPPTPKVASTDRGRNEGTGGRATSLPAQSRRANSADTLGAVEQRKISQPIHTERTRGEPRASRNAGDIVPKSADSARFPQSMSDESGPKIRHEFRSFHRAHEGISNSTHQRGYDQSSRHPSSANDGHSHPRYSGDRRGESHVRPSDFQREPRESTYTRERGESRSERGRGGYRGGRGAYSGASGQTSHNYSNTSMSQQAPTAYTPSKSQSYNERSYSDRNSQTQSGHYGGMSQSRSQRSNNRSQSIPSNASYQQYPTNGAPPPIQTDLPAHYAYPPMYAGMMSAMPYQPYMADLTVMSMVQMQMDYYFSVDNLCKDMYLRRHMDSQGFVPLTIIANFRRIRSLTDKLDLLREVCRGLENLELRVGHDGMDRIRKREGWQQWVLKMEDRDPIARNAGPPEANAETQSISYNDDVFSPHDPNNSRLNSGITMTPTNLQSHFPEYPNPLMPASPYGYVNGMMHTPLTHTAPEFIPSFPPLNLNDTPARDAPSRESFPDDLLDNIMVVCRNPGVSSPNSQQANQALSPGSNNERGSEENSTSKDTLSLRGDNVPSNLNNDRTPARLGNGTPPSFWVYEGGIPSDLLDDDVHERYTTFRPKALAERQSAPHGESPQNMDQLYNFWAHFLVDSFHPGMYKEFRTLALEDQSSRGTSSGMDALIKFYDLTLTAQKVVSPEIARDFVNIVRTESRDENRPAYHKLRSILRNGAFNLKSRKIIDKFLEPELKTELET